MDVVDWAPVLGLVAERRQRREAVRGAQGQASGTWPCIEATRSLRSTASPAIRGCRRSSAIANEGWYITSKREVDRWGRAGSPRARRRARLRCARAIDARPLHRHRAAHQERHAREAVREHPHLRLHVRGAGPAAGKERRRSRGDSRYAPIQLDDRNIRTASRRRLEDRSARQPRRHPRVLRLRHLRRVRARHRATRCFRRAIRSSR